MLFSYFVVVCALHLAGTFVSAHMIMVSPMSRRTECRDGLITGCGALADAQFEPQGPRGEFTCNGNGTRFSVLNNAKLFTSQLYIALLGKQSITFTWQPSIRQQTDGFDYVALNSSHRVLASFGGDNFPNTGEVRHVVPLSGLRGMQTILARSNLSNSAEAAYACVDLMIDP